MTTHRSKDNDGVGSTYRHPVTGERFASVTTIISGGVPKPALVPWAAKLVAEHAAHGMVRLRSRSATDEDGPLCMICSVANGEELVRHLKGLPNEFRDRRATAGSAVHHAIEEASLDPEDAAVTLLDHDDHLVRAWARWCAAYRPTFVASELTVVNRTLFYAGTLDAIVELPGWPGRWLVDWKSGKAIYPEVGLQLAAYRHAEFSLADDGTEVPMPDDIRGAAVLRLSPELGERPGYEFRKIDAGQRTFDAFLAARDIHFFGKRQDVIGPVIATGEEIEAASPELRAQYASMMNAHA